MATEITLTTRANTINELLASSRVKAQSAIDDAVLAGTELAAAKNAIGHGNWEGWLADNCQLSKREASRYMGLAREYPGLSGDQKGRLAGLSARAAADRLPSLVNPKPKTKSARLADLKNEPEIKMANPANLKNESETKTAKLADLPTAEKDDWKSRMDEYREAEWEKWKPIHAEFAARVRQAIEAGKSPSCGKVHTFWRHSSWFLLRYAMDENPDAGWGFFNLDLYLADHAAPAGYEDLDDEIPGVCGEELAATLVRFNWYSERPQRLKLCYECHVAASTDQA